MIPRPFDYPTPPPPEPIEPVPFDEVDATVIEFHFPNDTVVFTLFDGDTHETAGEAVLIIYQDNPRVGRFHEQFMIFRQQVYYMSERRVTVQVRREVLTPEELTAGSAGSQVEVQGEGDPPSS